MHAIEGIIRPLPGHTLLAARALAHAQLLPLPPALAAALEAAPEAKRVFDAFAPSHRREYIEWVAEAKREETRDKRVAQAIEWLGEGKKRHWKYEDC